jgi:hypothetical protein
MSAAGTGAGVNPLGGFSSAATASAAAPYAGSISSVGSGFVPRAAVAGPTSSAGGWMGSLSNFFGGFGTGFSGGNVMQDPNSMMGGARSMGAGTGQFFGMMSGVPYMNNSVLPYNEAGAVQMQAANSNAFPSFGLGTDGLMKVGRSSFIPTLPARFGGSAATDSLQTALQLLGGAGGVSAPVAQGVMTGSGMAGAAPRFMQNMPNYVGMMEDYGVSPEDLTMPVEASMGLDPDQPRKKLKWWERMIDGAFTGAQMGSNFGPYGAGGGFVFGGLDGAINGPIYKQVRGTA